MSSSPCRQLFTDVHALNEETSRDAALSCANQTLETLTAAQRVRWLLDNLPGQALLSSSFGAQAAVMLHLLTEAQADIPVVLIDTGYLFPETYRFVDQLADRLNLNLKVYRSQLSPAWQEARYGRRWESGLEGMNDYDKENKVEPMQRALDDLGATIWFAGLRRDQSLSRRQRQILEHTGNQWKAHPIADWTNRDVHYYLKANDLPYHPLWEKGYISIGDVQTTRSIHEVDQEEATRFFGLKRECGLHT